MLFSTASPDNITLVYPFHFTEWAIPHSLSRSYLKGTPLPRIMKPCPDSWYLPTITSRFSHPQAFNLDSQTNFFYSMLPSHCSSNPQPHIFYIRTYNFLHHSVLLHSLYMSKSSQNTLLCRADRLSHDVFLPSFFLILVSIHPIFTTYASHHLSATFNFRFSFTPAFHVKLCTVQLALLSLNPTFTLRPHSVSYIQKKY